MGGEMPQLQPGKKPAAAPTKAADAVLSRRYFDAWNAVSLGHQRAETTGPGGWRESRTAKLGGQLRAGKRGVASHVWDTAGAGSVDYDEKLGVLVTPEVRARAACSVLDMLRRPGAMAAAKGAGTSAGAGVAGSGCSSSTSSSSSSSAPASRTGPGAETITAEDSLTLKRRAEDDLRDGERKKEAALRGIFSGLTVYVNGSTHPLISDHRLKHVLAENGARMAIHLGRRQVTHVILGRPTGSGGVSGSGSVSGSGGGLAAGKLEREIRRVGGCGVKFVGAEWVLESVKAGRRLPEARFASLKLASRGQQSVYGTFSRQQGAIPSGSATFTTSTPSLTTTNEGVAGTMPPPPATLPTANNVPGARPLGGGGAFSSGDSGG